MDKTDNNALTNQPETRAIPPLASSRVMGCPGVGTDTAFDELQPAEIDESEIFVFGRVGDGGANSAEVEAEMTPPGELALALRVDVSSAAGGRLKSRPLLRNSGQKCRRWVPSWSTVHFHNVLRHCGWARVALRADLRS